MSGELEHDWYPRPLPGNVVLGERSWLHSAHALVHCASTREVALRIGDDSGVYHGTHFDLGPHASVVIGRCCTLVGAIVRCDGDVRIGDHVFISHEVVIADGPWAVPMRPGPHHAAATAAAGIEVDIGDDVWIGARATIIGAVRIGAGAIVGAGAVVTSDVPPGAVAAGNPAQVVRAG